MWSQQDMGTSCCAEYTQESPLCDFLLWVESKIARTYRYLATIINGLRHKYFEAIAQYNDGIASVSLIKNHHNLRHFSG